MSNNIGVEREVINRGKAGLENAADDVRELANCYARVFLGDDDGKRVLADLRAKFGVERLSFVPRADGRYDTISAALIEGQRQVMKDVEAALRLGAPGVGVAEKK